MTVAQWLAIIDRAQADLERADYIDSTARMEREKADARRRLATTIPHDQTDNIPVMPGTRCAIRFRGVMLHTTSPQTLDWKEITEWKPLH